MERISSKRYKFDYVYYDGDITQQRMLHIKIFDEGAMQVDLWLDEFDQKRLKEVLEGDK